MKFFRNWCKSKKQKLLNGNLVIDLKKLKSRKQILLDGNLVTACEEDLEKLMKNEGISYFQCPVCGNVIKWRQGLDIWCRCGKGSFGPGIVFCGEKQEKLV